MAVWADPAEVQGKANIENMFYVASDGMPWHEMGRAVGAALTAAEALHESGQDWTVSTEPLQTVSGIPITDGRRCKAIVRDDTRRVLGIVGARYRPIQNVQAFDFLDSLAASRTIRYHTAGVLGQGERIWILAQLHGEIRIPKTDDVIKKFLAFTNAHDGTAAGRAFWTPVRIVCQNTLNQAIRGAKGEGVTVRHTGSLDGKIKEAQRILGLAIEAYDDLDGQIKQSAKVKLTDAMRAAYFASLFGPKSKGNDEDGSEEEVSTRTQKTLNRLEELADHGRGNDNKIIRGTLWTAYNAVTELIDHERSTRVQNKADGTPSGSVASKRFESAMFGQGARVKEDAWEMAKKVMKDPSVLATPALAN